MQGGVSDEVVPEILYAYAVALIADDRDSEAYSYLQQAYHQLLDGAATFEEDSADFPSISGNGHVLNPGEPVILDYWMVPILYEDNTDYEIGHKDIEVEYVEISGETHKSAFVREELLLDYPVAEAVEGADYLIVTHPINLSLQCHCPPNRGKVSWQVPDNPDGSTTLQLMAYPFFYHPLITESEYYRHYDFTITTTTTALTITHLSTGRSGYEPGDWVGVDLQIQNDDPSLDVVVGAEIQNAVGEVVFGLLMRSLHDLSGPVAFEPSWDSTGMPAGDYRVVVTLQNSESLVLDRAEVDFRLGTAQGEITTLTVDPGTFNAGPAFEVTMVFSHTGTVPITDTAVVSVYRKGEMTTTATMTGTLANVQPGMTAVFTPTWDGSGEPVRDYQLQGVVKYDGQATSVIAVDLPASHRIYLPLVTKEWV